MTSRTRHAVALTALLMSGVPEAGADVVLDWNAIMVKTVSSQNPFAQARIAAITQLAVFEAVNAIAGQYKPYLDTPPAPRPSSKEAAAIAAAAAVLKNYFPSSAGELDLARAASLATVRDGLAKTNGIAVGETAAAAMIAHRSADGSAPPQFHMPASSEPGEWQLTPGCPAAGGILRHWGGVTPFGIKRAEDFRSTRPPALGSWTYARDYNEVKEVGEMNSSVRSPHKSDIARFYAAVLAVATWNPAVGQVAAAERTSLSENARLLALLNMAINDALVAVIETKYVYNFWRPETAIRSGDLDGNARTVADAGFTPYIAAPCFPSYGSAHAAASYAARHVAEAFFGDECPSITLSSVAVPGVVLHYSSFEEITGDIDDARVYGGIHFRFDQRAGARQGRRIGAWIYRHHLLPERGRDHEKRESW
jgi:hypothetical protein